MILFVKITWSIVVSVLNPNLVPTALVEVVALCLKLTTPMLANNEFHAFDFKFDDVFVLVALNSTVPPELK